MLKVCLVGCAGVTLGAVATAMEIPIHGGKIIAEGDADFENTGVSFVPVGSRNVSALIPTPQRGTIVERTAAPRSSIKR